MDFHPGCVSQPPPVLEAVDLAMEELDGLEESLKFATKLKSKSDFGKAAPGCVGLNFPFCLNEPSFFNKAM